MAKSELKVAGMTLMIEGGARFQSDLNTANQTSKALKSELKLLEAGTTSAGKNGLEFLRAKSESLSAQLAKQEQATRITKIALQEASTATEVDAKQVQKLEDAVLKSQIAEEKLRVSLIGVTDQISKSTNVALQHGIAQKKMGEEAQASGNKLAGVGDNISKYVTTPIIAAGVAIAALIVKSVDSADQTKKMSEVTGLTTDRVQELTYAGKDLDVELEIITKSMAKNIKSMKGAQDGTTLTVAAYDKLGVSVKNADGSLRDSETVYWEVIESLSGMSNETERDAIAMQLLGKSAQELNPLIKAGSAKLAELSAEAHKNGAVMSGEGIDALDSFGDSVEKAKVSIGTAAGEIAVKMMPTLEELLPIVKDNIVPAIGEFAETVGDLVVGYEKLDPVSKLAIQTIAGMVLVSGPAVTLLGKGIGLYGTLTAMQGTYTIAKATHTATTAASTAAVVSETTAVNALAAAEGTATVAGAGLSAVLGPIALIAAATVAIIAGSKYIIESNFKLVDDNMLACEASAAKLAESQTALDASTASLTAKIDDVGISFGSLNATMGTSSSDIDNYASSLQSASDKMSEWDGGITAAQDRLSGLAEQVAEESREYTEEEKAEISALIDTIDEYTKKKEELYQTHLQTLNAIVENEKNMSEEAMIAYNQQATDGYEELRKLADQAYADDIAAAIEKYGVEGSLNKKSYDNAIAVAQEAKEKKLATAKVSAEEVMKTTTETYAAQHASGVKYIENLTFLKNEEQRIKLERNKAVVDANTELQKTTEYQNASDAEKWKMICAEEAKINEEYDQKIIDADAALAAAQSDNGADQAAALIALVQSMADAGLTIDANTLAAVNAYLESMGLAKVDAATTAKEVADAVKKELETLPESASTTGTKTGFAFIDALNKSMSDSKIILPPIPGFSDPPLPKGTKIPAYASGIRYVPEDQLALIHKGEAVLTAEENPWNASLSLGGIATNRAMSNYGSLSNVVNNSTVEGSISVTMPGAVFNVRNDQDISKISKGLAREIVALRKAVGA